MIPLDASTWTQGDWFEAVLEPYVTLFGEPFLGTILGGALILSFYIYSGDIGMPAILTLLLGGVLTAVLPGHIVGVARMIIVVGLAAAFLAAAQRYVLD